MGLLGGIGGSFFDSLVGGINDALSALWGILKGVISGIAAFLQHLWNDVIKNVLRKILAAYLKLRSILAPIFARVLAWLQKARQILDYIFRRFVRPYLQMIQRVRQFLQIFRLLGFKWAARLDARLAAIEAKIISVFLTVRQPLNQIISFVGLIADPLGILRRNPVIGALLRNAPEIKNAIDRATAHPQTQAEVDTSNRNNGWFQQPARAGNATYFAQGQLPPDFAAARQEFIDAGTALPGLSKQEIT
jgi:hypothetical protein